MGKKLTCERFAVWIYSVAPRNVLVTLSMDTTYMLQKFTTVWLIVEFNRKIQKALGPNNVQIRRSQVLRAYCFRLVFVRTSLSQLHVVETFIPAGHRDIRLALNLAQNFHTNIRKPVRYVSLRHSSNMPAICGLDTGERLTYNLFHRIKDELIVCYTCALIDRCCTFTSTSIKPNTAWEFIRIIEDLSQQNYKDYKAVTRELTTIRND